MLGALLFGLLIVSAFVFFFVLVKMKRQTRAMRLQDRMIRKHVYELEAQNLQLENLNQEKLQLISLVSHDLKGPFNRIFALVQLMNLEPANLTDEQKELLAKIHQISVDGLSMVRNLLDNRSLGEKGIVLSETEMNLSILVSSLVKHYRPIAEKKKVEIIFESPGAILIMADKLYLSPAIENLISNAVKFSQENKKIFVHLLHSNDKIELSVIDEGPGISTQDQLKLFQRFQTLSAKPTGGESSTGLGLFITKTILEKMGAQIICSSEEEKGSSFKIVFPQKFLI